jgi:hypothetical protein
MAADRLGRTLAEFGDTPWASNLRVTWVIVAGRTGLIVGGLKS